LQRILDLADAQPERGQLLSVDVERDDRALVLQVGIVTSTKPGNSAQAIEHDVVPLIELRSRSVSCRVYWYCALVSWPPMRIGGGFCRRHSNARHGGQLGAQALR
jgi:hypothetical protein